MEAGVKKTLGNQGRLHLVWGNTLYDKDQLPFRPDMSDLPDVFTPFRNKAGHIKFLFPVCLRSQQSRYLAGVHACCLGSYGCHRLFVRHRDIDWVHQETRAPANVTYMYAGGAEVPDTASSAQAAARGAAPAQQPRQSCPRFPAQQGGGPDQPGAGGSPTAQHSSARPQCDALRPLYVCAFALANLWSCFALQ